MMKNYSFAGVVVLICLVSLSHVSGDAQTPLLDRVDQLERTVLKDTTRPGGTVLERLDVIEKSIKPADEQGATNEALKKTLDAQTAVLEKLDHRLKALEARASERQVDTLNDSLRKLTDEVADQRRIQRDLADRLKRVEQIIK
jgi:predicted nuclease with TOPRIM domain